MGRIVVGVDGSEGGDVALAWALEEARIRGATLDGVTAWSYLDQPHLSGDGGAGFRPDYGEEDARAVLDAALDRVGARDDDDVRRTVVNDLPARAVLDAAEGADLVVVGSRGLGGFRELLLGSVSQQVSHHAPCPVVIVPRGRR